MSRIRSSVCISIVSHGQGNLIRGLLRDLRSLEQDDYLCYETILTLNIPENEAFIGEFRGRSLQVLRNHSPKGFGANHNAAFAVSSRDVFIVANPDIRLRTPNISQLIANLSSPKVGACAPLVLSSRNTVEDSARKFPTLARLARRVFLGYRELDYQIDANPVLVDWVAGMFVAFPRKVFAEIGGFDERFFMYMEDADICRRLHHRGLSVVLDPTVSVIHDAQRASRRNPKHIMWHTRSAIRFLTGI